MEEVQTMAPMMDLTAALAAAQAIQATLAVVQIAAL